jgi:hypothetical protein
MGVIGALSRACLWLPIRQPLPFRAFNRRNHSLPVARLAVVPAEAERLAVSRHVVPATLEALLAWRFDVSPAVIARPGPADDLCDA